VCNLQQGRKENLNASNDCFSLNTVGNTAEIVKLADEKSLNEAREEAEGEGECEEEDGEGVVEFEVSDDWEDEAEVEEVEEDECSAHFHSSVEEEETEADSELGTCILLEGKTCEKKKVSKKAQQERAPKKVVELV
jgi:hypothetical protein